THRAHRARRGLPRRPCRTPSARGGGPPMSTMHPPAAATGTVTAAPLTAAEILARCRTLVHPGLTAAVERLHPWPAEMAAFSFGWCDVGGRPTPGPGGKGV